MFGFSNSSWCMQSLKTCGVCGFGMLVAILTCSFLKALVTNSEGGGGRPPIPGHVVRISYSRQGRLGGVTPYAESLTPNPGPANLPGPS